MTLTSYLAASLSLPRAKPGPICPSAPAEMANAVSDLGGYVVYVVLALVGVTIAASVGRRIPVADQPLGDMCWW